ncbi:hypothetical protein GCK72_006767 [Caenorhabditis remanei]|uniref:Uncharacterized protein n=1 Tax=Caenorhabditis remanei TaxID=31234 RepID=A0A6A5HHH3_CAERE|nr:hypothetical protein GCK72_006767 [Caenorhabditis remanei]KAF1766809.1 hypothetical protein GCK72_006767 [Caenorhabditis remanei]
MIHAQEVKPLPFKTLELWEGPPLYPLEDLPEDDGTRQMSLMEYMDAVRKQRGLHMPKHSDHILKKVVFNEIEKIPGMWSTKATTNQPKFYQCVGIGVYKRTGKILPPKYLATIFKFGKDAIRNRLRNAILHKRLSPVEVEEHMWRWDFYGYIRYYRTPLKPWEQFVRKQANALDQKIYHDVEDSAIEDGEMMGVEEEFAEEDDYQVDEKSMGGLDDVKVEEPTNGYMEQYSPPQYYAQPLYSAQHSEKLHQNHQYSPPNVPQQGIQMAQMYPPRMREVPSLPTSNSSASEEKPGSSSSFAIDFEKEMNQITYHATRIAREQPNRVKMIRKVLFDSVFAFDEKEYNSAGEVYRDLADRNPVRKFN